MIYKEFKYEYTDDGGVMITRYIGNSEHVAIPPYIDGRPVTVIDWQAFVSRGIKSIEIPNTIETIYEEAFLDCGIKEVYITDIAKWCAIDFKEYVFDEGYVLYLNGEKVTDLVIPNAVTSIGSYAFSKCGSITSVEIPSSVTSIGCCAFFDCSSLVSVNMPSSVTSIGDCAFSHCSSLKSIEIPGGVTSIGDYTFHECSSLESIDMPSCVTGIGDSAFDGCSRLKSIKIPSSVISIGDWAFYECRNLKSIEMSNSVISIGEGAFFGCVGLRGVYIADLTSWCAIEFEDDDANPLTYAYNLYLNNELLTDLKIADGVKTVKSFAFARSNIQSLVFANDDVEVEIYAFCDCDKLNEVIISSNVTVIHNKAFDGCDNVENIIVDSKNEHYRVENNCLIDNATGAVILKCNEDIN